MIYTDTGKYAVRAVRFLASVDAEDTPVPAARIAAAEEIPPFYLSKVLKDLVRAGILDSVRGRGGGFRLARPADEITVLEVLEAAEGTTRRFDACILGLDGCHDEMPCPLHDAWKSFKEPFLRTLGELTIAGLVQELQRKRAAAGEPEPRPAADQA